MTTPVGTVPLIDPRLITCEYWAAATGWGLAPIATIPVLQSEHEWRNWADFVVGIPQIAALNAPRPERFEDWREWAAEFNQTARLLTY